MNIFLMSNGECKQGHRQLLQCGPAQSLTGGKVNVNMLCGPPWPIAFQTPLPLSRSCFKFQSFSNSLTNLHWTWPGILIFFFTDQPLASYTIPLISNSEPVPFLTLVLSFGYRQFILRSHTYLFRLLYHTWVDKFTILMCAFLPYFSLQNWLTRYKPWFWKII